MGYTLRPDLYGNSQQNIADEQRQDLTINPLLVMTIEASTSVAPFARTCQAAHLLGLVCEHVNQDASSVAADLHF